MITILRLDSKASEFAAQFAALLASDVSQDAAIDNVVASIVDDVRHRGDVALLEYTRRFDAIEAVSVAQLEITHNEMEHALATLPRGPRDALDRAAARIRSYHQRQRAQSWSYIDNDGTQLGQQVTAIDRVGLYVPGGTAAYPSSVLMNALPAKVAGVREIVLTVPTPRAEKNPLVLAAAALCGVDRAFAIGGAQAIAALAYGTTTIPAVDKIVGPGNAYVAAAKRRVFGAVGIDMIAGPSEILIVSDGSTNPDWIAMDLFAQAEHDEMARALLLSPDANFIAKVADSMERHLAQMPRHRVIRASLEKRGALIKVRDLEEACELVNRIAPEHLELAVTAAETWLPKVRHAGAIFLGNYSSEAVGDYCAGPNHVLPTARSARFSSPLGVYDFQKRSSVISLSKKSAMDLGAIAAELARGEGMLAHANSAECRMK